MHNFAHITQVLVAWPQGIREKLRQGMHHLSCYDFSTLSFPHAYYRLSSRSPVRIPYSISHVTFPFTVTLLFVITCQRGSSSFLSQTLTHYAYLLISAAPYNTLTHCGRPFPGLSCI